MLELKQYINNIKSEWYLWVTAFLVLCLSFSPLLFNFIWGNHDWLPLIQDNRLSSGLIEGRFSQYLLLNVILDGKILPIFNIIFGFLLYALALYGLSRYYFCYKNSKLTAAVFICTVASMPYITEIMYFHFITLSLLSWPLFITLSLIATQKSTEKHFLLWELCGFGLLFLSLGGYPGCINMYVTAAICRLIQIQTSHKPIFTQLLKKALPYALNIILALGSLKITYSYLQQNHLMMSLYNSQGATPLELLQKLPAIIQASLMSFTETQPFISLTFKIFLSLIFTLFITTLCFSSTLRKKTLSNTLILAGLILCLLVCLKFSAWLVSEQADNPFATLDPATSMLRTDFYSYPILTLFCLFFIHQQKPILLKNLSFIMGLILLITNINNNLIFSKTHLLGFSAENKLLERIISRIQENPEYQTHNLYTVIQAGELPLRSKFYMKKAHEKYGYYTLNTPYSRHWIAFEYYNFYAPQYFVQEGTSITPNDITPQMVNYLSKQMHSWPHPNAVYVDKNYAIIALTPEGKDLLSRQFRLLHLPLSNQETK